MLQASVVIIATFKRAMQNFKTRIALRGHALKRRLGLAALLLCGSVCYTPALAAETFPARPIRLVVGYAAGNPTDLLARTLAEQMAEVWKRPIVIDNRPGVGGSLGAQIVAKAPPDGYTLLFSAIAASAINPHVYPNVGYDAIKDFTPIIGVCYVSGVLFVSSAIKATSLQELIEYSKGNPGKLNYGSAGSGTVPHLGMEALKAQTGLIAEHIPYKGSSQLQTDLAGGRIQMQWQALTSALPQIRAGKGRALVAFSDRRLPELPDVPAITEVLPKFENVTPWLGLLGPARMPVEVVANIHKTADDILRTRAMSEKLQSYGMVVLRAPPDEFRAMIAQDFERLGKLARDLNLKVD